MIRSIDSDKNGAINYTEFIAATLTGNILSDDQKIQIAFDVLDKNGDGFIGEKELAQLIGAQEDNQMIKSLIHDVDDSNKINF